MIETDALGLKVHTDKSKDAISDCAKIGAELIIGRTGLWHSTLDNDTLQTRDFRFMFLQIDLLFSVSLLQRPEPLLRTCSEGFSDPKVLG